MSPATVAGHSRNFKGTPQLMRNPAGTYDYGTVIVLPESDVTPNTALLFRRHVATGAVDTFDLATIPGNPIGFPMGNDGHWVLSVAVAYSNPADNHDVLHIMGNGHNQPWHYGYVDVSTWPPSGWTFPSFASMPWASLGVEMHTYHHWLRLPDGTIILFSEQEPTATPGVEGRIIHGWYMLPHTVTLLPLCGAGKEVFVASEQSAPVNVPDRVYPNGATVSIQPDGSLRIWFWGIWAQFTQEGLGTWYRQSPFCMWFDASQLGTGVWHDCAGTALPIPYRYANRGLGVVTIGTAPADSMQVCGPPAIDAAGNPHLVMLRAQADPPPDWKHCWWDGTAWQGAYLLGQDMGPNIVAVGANLFIETETNKRLRLEYLNTPWTAGTGSGKPALVGGPVPIGSAPTQDPTGCFDRTRLTFMIPDGDTPVTYDMKVPTVPRAG